MKKSLPIIVSSVLLLCLFTSCPEPAGDPPGQPLESFVIKDVSARQHTMVAMESGMVWSFGKNDHGQLGNGFTTNSTQPVLLMKNSNTAMTNVVKVSAGGQHSLILLSNGEAWAVGSNNSGQLGDGTTTDRLYPVRVKTNTTTYLENVVAISAGGEQSIFLCNDGTVWSTGDNDYGKLGLFQDTDSDAWYATQIEYSSDNPINNVSGISTRAQFTLLALKPLAPDANTGEALGFGDNTSGQLGQGKNSTTLSYLGYENGPASVFTSGTTSLLNVVSVHAGASHSLVLLTNGTVVAIGSNNDGQLGIGTYTSLTFPQTVKYGDPVDTLPDVEQTVAGAYHSLFLLTDKTLLATGKNAEGEYGDGSTTQSNLPKVVTPPTGKVIAKIFAGDFHSLYLMTDGTLWATGSNEFGQLGVATGSATSVTTPVQVVFQ
ncbi:MAG: hypothetical protein RBR15_13265 [Sphaerochaeta sp.]|nr:hypothetical protein [Sphaerochaeta sp.]